MPAEPQSAAKVVKVTKLTHKVQPAIGLRSQATIVTNEMAGGKHSESHLSSVVPEEPPSDSAANEYLKTYNFTAK